MFALTQVRPPSAKVLDKMSKLCECVKMERKCKMVPKISSESFILEKQTSSRGSPTILITVLKVTVPFDLNWFFGQMGVAMDTLHPLVCLNLLYIARAVIYLITGDRQLILKNLWILFPCWLGPGGEWSTENALSKLLEGTEWKTLFRGGVNLDEKFVEQYLCNQSLPEYDDYQSRYDLTFRTPNRGQLTLKVRPWAHNRNYDQKSRRYNHTKNKKKHVEWETLTNGGWFRRGLSKT